MQILTVGQSSHDEDDGEKVASGQQQQSKQDLRTAMQKKGKKPKLPSCSHRLFLCLLTPFPSLTLSPSLSRDCYSVFFSSEPVWLYSVISKNNNGVLSCPKVQELSRLSGMWLSHLQGSAAVKVPGRC